MSQQRKDWVYSALFLLLSAGVTWAATGIMDHATRIAVEENNTTTINKTLDELKEGQKTILAEMRR